MSFDEPRCAIYNADREKVRDIPVEATDRPGGYRFTEPFTLKRDETLWCAMPGLDHLVQIPSPMAGISLPVCGP